MTPESRMSAKIIATSCPRKSMIASAASALSHSMISSPLSSSTAIVSRRRQSMLSGVFVELQPSSLPSSISRPAGFAWHAPKRYAVRAPIHLREFHTIHKYANGAFRQCTFLPTAVIRAQQISCRVAPSCRQCAPALIAARRRRHPETPERTPWGWKLNRRNSALEQRPNSAVRKLPQTKQ